MGYSAYTTNNTLIKSDSISVKKIKEIAKMSSLDITLSSIVNADSNTFFIQKHLVAYIVANATLSTNVSKIKMQVNI